MPATPPGLKSSLQLPEGIASTPVYVGFEAPELEDRAARGDDVLVVGAEGQILLGRFCASSFCEGGLVVTPQPEAMLSLLRRGPHATRGRICGLADARPGAMRRAVQQLVLSAPSLGERLLPEHVSFANLFGRLRRIVLPDLDRYDGEAMLVLALSIARLLRVARFYGSRPQLIASAERAEDALLQLKQWTDRDRAVVVRARPTGRGLRASLERSREGEVLEWIAAQGHRALLITADRAQAQRIGARLQSAMSSGAVQVLRAPNARTEAKVWRMVEHGQVRVVVRASCPDDRKLAFGPVCGPSGLLRFECIAWFGTSAPAAEVLASLAPGGLALGVGESKSVRHRLALQDRERQLERIVLAHLAAADAEIPMRAGESLWPESYG